MRTQAVPAYHLHAVYGLIVASDMRLISAPEIADRTGDPSIRISVESPEYFDAFRPASIAHRDDWVQHAVLADGGVFMKAEDVFETVISADGRDVFCRKLGNVDQRSFEANLLNFVLSASLTLQGEEPLHATVVEVAPGRAVGLLGLSGAGKSTLAACLISRGADLVTDDMLRMEFADDGVFAYPGPYRLKLFEEPGKRYLPEAVAHGYFNPVRGKIMVQPRRTIPPQRPPVRLSALFHLADPAEYSSAGATVSSSRLTGVELAKVLISSAMDNRYAEARRLTRQIEFATRLAGALPIYELRYPRSFDVMEDVAAEIHRAMSKS